MAGAAGGVSANPMQQAAGAQQQALSGTANAGTIAGTNLQQYQNPFTQQVIDAAAQDTMRNAQIGLNNIGAQATAANAFGGSRHGIAIGEMGRGVAQMLGQQAANLRSQGFMNAQQMAQQDIQNRMTQAAQLGNLGQQSFGYGQALQQNLAQQGQQQQALQQALIDAAKSQYEGYASAPATSLGYVTSALGATPVPQTQTTQKNLGLMDYLTMATAFLPKSDIRLKTKMEFIGRLDNGIKLYQWEWTELGEKLKAPDQPNHGVIAQEVMDVIPDAVMMGADGYYGVNYNHPELRGAL